ncbi:MAG: glycosyltransferase family 2 protein [Planctomycetota bacterium]
MTCMNNATTIRRTLESVRDLAAEIVLVDSGSTDATLRIAAEFPSVRVIHQTWLGHVRQKQVALEACRSTWVFSLDSDESVEPDLAASIRRTFDARRTNCSGSVDRAATDAVTGYEVNRRLFMAGRWLRHAFQPEWRLRLVRRADAAWGGYDPHDKLELIRGRSERLDGTLRHDAFTSVAELVRKQVAHGLRAAESYHAMRRTGSTRKAIVSPVAATLKQLVARQGWRDGWPGVAVSIGAGINAAVKHIALLELTHAAEHAERSIVPPTVPGADSAAPGRAGGRDGTDGSCPADDTSGHISSVGVGSGDQAEKRSPGPTETAESFKDTDVRSSNV